MASTPNVARRSKMMCITLDRMSMRKLDLLAKEYNNNRSAALREMIRMEYRRFFKERRMDELEELDEVSNS